MITSDKLDKIKRLMDKTSGLEHEQIKRKYEQLLANYNTMCNKVNTYTIVACGALEAYLYRIIKLMINADDLYSESIDKYGRIILEFDLTELEYEQLKLYYEYYYPILKDEVFSFVAAFGLKNDILPKNKDRSGYDYGITDDAIKHTERMYNTVGKYDKPNIKEI